jgi:hypothetical protein
MRLPISPLAMMALLGLGAIDLWLAAVAVDTMTAGDEAAPATFQWTPKLAATAEGAAKAKAETKPSEAYGEILAHPVFFKTRTPFVPPPPPPPPPPPQIAAPPPVDPGLALGGVTIARGVRKAYLFTRTDPKGTWVNEGESFMGWTVEAVGSTSTKLQQQGRTIELELYAKR